jgi:hypothetical protein
MDSINWLLNPKCILKKKAYHIFLFLFLKRYDFCILKRLGCIQHAKRHFHITILLLLLLLLLLLFSKTTFGKRKTNFLEIKTT